MIPLSWVGLGVPCRGLTAIWKRIFNRFIGTWRHSKCQLGCCDMCKVMKPNTLIRTLVVKSLRHTVPSHAGLFNRLLLTFHNPEWYTLVSVTISDGHKYTIRYGLSLAAIGRWLSRVTEAQTFFIDLYFSLQEKSHTIYTYDSMGLVG